MEWPSNCPKLLSSFAIYLTIITTLSFFIFFSSLNFTSKTPHRILLTPPPSCLPPNYTNKNGIFNYFYPHFCIFNSQQSFSVPFLLLALFLQFFVLIKTAQDHFSIVVTKVANQLRLSPSMGAVTLLALGNGAPDVFASVAAVRGGQPRTGFGAILSAGTFVSAFVVGFVAIYAAPFSVDPAPFIRDVMFYLVAALFLFYVYLSAEIYLWQAVGFVGFYLFFVAIVFWMDFGISREKEKGRSGEDVRLIHDGDLSSGTMEMDYESGDFSKRLEHRKGQDSGFWIVLGKVLLVWKIPVSILLKLTIPETSPSDWNRFYQSANIALCPLALLYSCKSFMPLDHLISFLLPSIHFPLWSVVLFCSCSLATLHYLVEKGPPKTEQLPTVLVAFVMSVFWISTVAGELLNCLEALGIILELPTSLLGLTVLAWGNSVGDLVADVAVAKAGQPAMAMAGCFAGPMFNMLFGLGTALVIQTADVYPKAYELHFHVSIVVAFIFLLMSLMGSLLVVTWHRFRVPRFWGFCLVCLYVIFMVTSLVIATFSA